ncbi:MAG TPA: SRPBCC family protein, partial [Thermoanaerobaculia bacterium]|nr:SRPBCC family protein [Thermoanaerobaculia bacterium]
MLPVLALLAAGPPATAADASALTREELARLDRGEVVARLVPLPGEAGRSARAGLAARVLPSSPERLFRAAADADHWAEWVPFLEGSERSAEAGGGVSWRLAF